MNEPHANVRLLFDTIKPSPDRELSPVEARLLELLADGLSEGEVARELSVPVGHVGSRVDELVAKLRARTTLHALAIAFRRGLLPLERRQEER
jgi:DNA-binding NarL/FixJ family response regulator